MEMQRIEVYFPHYISERILSFLLILLITPQQACNIQLEEAFYQITYSIILFTQVITAPIIFLDIKKSMVWNTVKTQFTNQHKFHRFRYKYKKVLDIYLWMQEQGVGSTNSSLLQ